MKNRITELFERKKENILSIFFTAGYPTLNDTGRIIRLLESSGADMIEIGIPFSDPLADGPVIQKSSERALKNGMSLSLLFEQLKEIRKEVKIPILLMGYLNPVLQFGIESFVLKCKETGIDGIILPDLPPDVYRDQYKSLFDKNQVAKIFLITPDTSSERIKEIDSIGSGFIYLVSSSSTTGKKAVFDESNYHKINSISLSNPLMIGFGITNAESFQLASRHAKGGIIGTAFIKAIENGRLEEKIPEFISGILNIKMSQVLCNN
jgi:tryptophan synthase alpha chain